MPFGTPFILYRYSGHCQKVMNMAVQHDYIQWIDEPIGNGDEKLGKHPDDNGGMWKHKLHYCYYS